MRLNGRLSTTKRAAKHYQTGGSLRLNGRRNTTKRVDRCSCVFSILRQRRLGKPAALNAGLDPMEVQERIQLRPNGRTAKA